MKNTNKIAISLIASCFIAQASWGGGSIDVYDDGLGLKILVDSNVPFLYNGNVYGSNANISPRNKPDDSGNTLTIKDAISSNIVNRLFAGYAYYNDVATANSNTMNINGSITTTKYLEIQGGNVYTSNSSGEASSNKLYINRNIKSNDLEIQGGSVRIHLGDAKANSNIVNINADLDTTFFNNSITGGTSWVNTIGNADASYNTVNINGNIKSAKENIIRGGYANSTETGTATATNNTVNLLSNASFTGSTTISGGYAFVNSIKSTYQDNFDSVAKGNKLNIYSKSIEVKNIQNFEFVNFYLSNDIKADDTILTLTDTISTDLSKSRVGVGLMNGGTPALNVDDKVTLISNLNGILAPTNMTNNISAMQGISQVYDFELSTTDDDDNPTNGVKSIVATTIKKSTNEKQKAINEGAISSSLSAVSSSEQVDSALNAINSLSFNGFGEASSGSMGASSIKSNTGSYVDSNMIGLIAAISKRANDSFIYSAFFEAGYGKYDSFNSFDSGDIKGSGDNSYFGFGLMSKTNLVNNFYIDNSIKFGQVKSDFKSDDFGDSSNKISASFDSKRAYYGLSLGVGNIIELDNRSNLDIYTKLYYTRVGSDSVDMSTNDKFRLDTFNSFIAKLGARYNYEIKESTTLYTGAAYEYEFDAKQKGYNLSYNYEIDPTDMQGSSGSIEAGIKLKPLTNSDRLTLDLGIKGLSGKKEGVSGNVGIEWRL
ncbi:autotransporter domain protein [Campylobacter iguaniorum]|uniref:autotransporter outer membrane beta-barrel domain-containing protein n=1 Tax=Campylobacter iguaniorum TaxID=1244531 RepID=UPI00073A1D02|nr:autotransporter outer membrane beta-barrel domain-containing protein [Campylobacter iguaniorum]ALV24646.1 autotransporter domain protein [Campylobacter iguaniorum]